MSIKTIDTQFVKNIYNEDEMKNYYTNITKEIGLFKCEEILFKKYLNLEDKIIDLGCGAGRTTIPLYNMGYKNITGLDIAEGMIKSAKSLCNNIDFVIGDVTDIQFNDETFDKAIFSFNGLMLIPKLESRLKALKEINRILKNNGYFIFSTPYMDNKLHSKFWINEEVKWQKGNFDARLYEFGDILMDDLNIKNIFIHIPKINEIEKSLKETGFELIDYIPRLDICMEEENIEEILDDGLFWITKKV